MVEMINFAEEAKSCFKFLSQGHNFQCTSETPNRVRYESRDVFVEIYYGSRDGEVAIEFGRLNEKEKFSFTLFLRMVNPTLERKMGNRIAWNIESLRRDLSALANALRSEGLPIINNDDEVIDRMKDVRWWHFRPTALKEKFRK